MRERTIAGRYRLLEPLSQEGEWLAEDTELGRRVSLRLLDPNAEPLGASARAAAGLAHPHLGRVYDHGESEGIGFVVTEHLPGGSLETRLATGGPLPPAAADRVVRDIASALAYAHAQGVFHGDVTTASVGFDGEGRAKVTGFATASSVTASGAADAIAFGRLAFCMLTGREPEDSAALERVRPDVPTLVATVRAALRGEAADGSALVALLGPEPTRLLAEEESHTEVPAAVRHPRGRRRATVAMGTAVGLLALLGAGIAAAFLAGGDGATPPPSLSLPLISTASTAASDAPAETAAPSPSTSTEATTSSERTTTARTARTTTQAPQPTAPPPTFEPPPPTEETTPTTTVEPTTAAATTTDPGTTATTP